MIRLAVALALAAALSASPAAAAQPPPLCKALHGLAEAARDGEPLRISMADDPAACRSPRETAAVTAFCAAAVDATGPALGWDLYECVNSMADDPRITTTDGATGFRRSKQLAHLAANLGDGVRLDVVYAQDTRRYDLVVWRPK